MFVPNENRQLKAGMAVCLEPFLEAFWHLQNQLLITNDGPELLSAGLIPTIHMSWAEHS
jgi:hypothetical protein